MCKAPTPVAPPPPPAPPPVLEQSAPKTAKSTTTNTKRKGLKSYQTENRSTGTKLGGIPKVNSRGQR